MGLPVCNRRISCIDAVIHQSQNDFWSTQEFLRCQFQDSVQVLWETLKSNEFILLDDTISTCWKIWKAISCMDNFSPVLPYCTNSHAIKNIHIWYYMISYNHESFEGFPRTNNKSRWQYDGPDGPYTVTSLLPSPRVLSQLQVNRERQGIAWGFPGSVLKNKSLRVNKNTFTISITIDLAKSLSQ